MTAGLNIRIRVWRLTEFADDESGGAIVSGSVLYDSLDARMTALKPSPLLLQQGLEVQSMFRVMVQSSHLDFREFDVVEVIWPLNHKYYGELMEIRKIQEDSLHPLDRRSFVEFTLGKMKYSRSNYFRQSQ